MRFILLFTLAVFLTACGQPVDERLLKSGTFSYPKLNNASCANAYKSTSLPTHSDDHKTSTGARYNIRAPSNYDPSFAHPLIVVFAPAGTSAKKSERLVHLTKEATEAGYIIAYANNKRLSLKAINQLASIPEDIKSDWCIDASRVYFTGHSDGGTITNALAFLPSSDAKPTAIAPSAAGIDGASLKQYECPSALPVMVFHNTNDSHFDGFGEQAARWWANCNQCNNTLSPPDDNGCRAFNGCPTSSPTYFCETEGSHSDWPNKNSVLIDFFNRSL